MSLLGPQSPKTYVFVCPRREATRGCIVRSRYRRSPWLRHILVEPDREICENSFLSHEQGSETHSRELDRIVRGFVLQLSDLGPCSVVVNHLSVVGSSVSTVRLWTLVVRIAAYLLVPLGDAFVDSREVRAQFPDRLQYGCTEGCVLSLPERLELSDSISMGLSKKVILTRSRLTMLSSSSTTDLYA